jgi:hypothetical protein
MGVSTRSLQVHPANFFKFDEIFTADRAVFSDHFGIEKFDFCLHLPCKTCKILFFVFVIFSKKILFSFKNLDIAP